MRIAVNPIIAMMIIIRPSPLIGMQLNGRKPSISSRFSLAEVPFNEFDNYIHRDLFGNEAGN